MSLVGSCLPFPGPGTCTWLLPPSVRALPHRMTARCRKAAVKCHRTTNSPVLLSWHSGYGCFTWATGTPAAHTHLVWSWSDKEKTKFPRKWTHFWVKTLFVIAQFLWLPCLLLLLFIIVFRLERSLLLLHINCHSKPFIQLISYYSSMFNVQYCNTVSN